MSEVNGTPAVGKQCSVQDLLTWKDPVKTGKVFGGLILTLLVFKTVNLFNVFFHLAYLGLLISAAAEYAGRLVTGTGFVTKYKPQTHSHSARFNDEVLPRIASFNEKLEEEVKKILFAHNIETTLKGAALSYILYKVTSYFSLYALITTAVVLTFTLPAVYVKNKKEIDAAVAQYSKIASEKATEFTNTASKQAQPYVDSLVEKSGPLGSFIKKNLPTRTAGSTVGGEKEASTASTSGASKTADAPSTASTSGASKFPEVPTSSLDKSTMEDFVDEASSKIPEAH
ncbi:Piso0_000324 [Millerozyma farinosa CBS 7064]|uniref:Reticulon-like protein n=1 Tax=Pichia sorbitophila (strain ATCC MYA-4447 / BCRC 22081 / CBS 7064 / NBRC 10061 / NRRL Y-12695) TaxID=559304 RepID=G8YTP0_PICSO|nr:Piso0_000324 [Millerozyma farinosa CBS 7064]